MKRTIVIAVLIFFGLNLRAQNIKILINHIGYEKEGPKHAVVRGKLGDEITTFTVVDSKTNKKVITGKPQKTGTVDKWKDWHFWDITFDELNTEGTYHITCETNKGIVSSFDFVVQQDLLERNTLSNVVYYFKGQRSSGLLDKADRSLKFGGEKPGIVDAHGGWFDATGDYGKHLSHLSYSTYFNPQQIPLTVWSLLKTHQVLSGEVKFKQYKRRILDEGMYGADYLIRMKAPNGSFYRSVSGGGTEKLPEDRKIGVDRTGFLIKTAENKDKIMSGEMGKDMAVEFYEVSYRSGGGMAIAALAMASTFSTSGDFQNSDYLKVAEDAFAFLEKNNASYTNDGVENIVDDYCALMAANELYKATKKDEYLKAADKRAENLINRLVSDDNYKNYLRADNGTRPFFHAADAGLPIVALAEYLPIAKGEKLEKAMETIRKYMEFQLEITAEVNNPFGYARQYVQNKEGVRRSSFFYPHDAETAPWWQGENARLGSLATAARLSAPYFESDKNFQNKLKRYSWDQLNWILGLNPYDASMLQGTGRNNIEYMFFNTYQYTNAPGGINNGITGGFYNPNDIDYDLRYAQTGKDDDWRWAEQWLPHASWYLIAISLK
ncbi:MAG TPA: glycoside hydrolase family 9 protein [Cytophagales bacterium]|nr:glycoside hydrolase family 9 protein [Cytophagales bacterium]